MVQGGGTRHGFDTSQVAKPATAESCQMSAAWEVLKTRANHLRCARVAALVRRFPGGLGSVSLSSYPVVRIDPMEIDGLHISFTSIQSSISHRIHGAAIYGKMDPINIPPMLAYIPYMDPMGLWMFMDVFHGGPQGRHPEFRTKAC